MLTPASDGPIPADLEIRYLAAITMPRETGLKKVFLNGNESSKACYQNSRHVGDEDSHCAETQLGITK